MALEVQEISIGMKVTSGCGDEGASSESAEAGTPLDQELIIKECVRRVLHAVKQMKER